MIPVIAVIVGCLLATIIGLIGWLLREVLTDLQGDLREYNASIQRRLSALESWQLSHTQYHGRH